MRLLLVHSPAVGPSTWRWVAGVLRSVGHKVIVPNLVPAATTGYPAAFARAAVHGVATGEEIVVVGHSAAGPVLPLVAGCFPKLRRVVFVDATIPPCEGTSTVGGDFLGLLQQLAPDGTLPIWSRWWGDEVLPALVRDEVRRGEVERELPTLPLAFFQTPITLPREWCAWNGAFLLLSEFYRRDASRAAALGWPVAEHPGAHLDMVNEEEAVTEILVALAEHP